MGIQKFKRPVVAPSFTPSADGIATSNIQNSAVTTAKLANTAVTAAKVKYFAASAQTGSGSSQDIVHGLGGTPTLVIAYPTDGGTLTEGSHDGTNLKITCTNSKKYNVVAFA